MILMTCIVHNKRKEKFNQDFKEMCNERLNAYEGASTDLINNLKHLWSLGPWRYNDIYGFVEVANEGRSRILGYHFYKHRNEREYPRHKRGIYINPLYSYSQAWIGNPNLRATTNEDIIKAIKLVLKQEDKFFKKKRKYLEYSELIVENTNWLNII